ncbi:PQQ-dependent sugar dehydrogenase [Cognatishimia sp. MH4019]|uniref:PQQ-dependent sugar dehydrogenase n=1 Tax=Cognatishimia sp. MH4019 TaxID=2854030 RepID=UPI001CD28DE1|nr:PQQ-dependent sugar dehydrogenase [Cognatishimia sp. MH4019]
MRRLLLVMSVLVAMPMAAQALQSESGPLQVSVMADDLDAPWAMGFLPGGGFLVTERGGTLLHFRPNGRRIAVSGLPEIAVGGQGGLLDILIPRDFAETREVLFTYAKAQGRGEGTALAAGILSADGTALQNVRVLFEIERGSNGGRHFGSRLVEANDGTIFMTVGDRGDRPSAQDLGVHNGSVLRLNRDGSVPSNNPFVDEEGAQPEIWSYGHRNPQGAALDTAGQLWVNEHGARGGDEVNRVQRGANYGWPVISYGRHYSGLPIGEGTTKIGLQQPVHYWDPSIAPSGMMIYTGEMFPEWEGDMFVGSLKFGLISRLSAAGDEEERIAGPETDRVRDIRQAPDGSIWVMSVGNGAIYRLSK